MKKLLFIATVLLSVLSFSSCKEDDPDPIIWAGEYNGQDDVDVSLCAPWNAYGVEISASADYSGDIILKCTNYPELLLNANNYDGTYTGEDTGLTVRKIDANTLKFTLEPIKEMDKDVIDVYDVVLVEGRNGKESYISNILVERKNKANSYHQKP